MYDTPLNFGSEQCLQMSCNTSATFVRITPLSIIPLSCNTFAWVYRPELNTLTTGKGPTFIFLLRFNGNLNIYVRTLRCLTSGFIHLILSLRYLGEAGSPIRMRSRPSCRTLPLLMYVCRKYHFSACGISCTVTEGTLLSLRTGC